VILDPIRSAIDLIESRVLALKTELSVDPPNTKTLQNVLQGSILLQVNQGPLAVAQTFLAHPDQYPSEQVEQLREGMANFVRSCGFVLKFNKKLITEDQVPFHARLEEAYLALQEETNKYLQIT